MIGTSMYTTILTLYKQGISQRKIARTTNVHRKTVKNIINRYEKSKIETPVPYNRQGNCMKVQIQKLLYHKSIK